MCHLLHICQSQGERNISPVAFRQVSSFSLKGFFRFFLTWVEGLRTDRVITLKTVKASEANTDLGL